uniref:AMP-binding enzyme n=1 Tax=Candidatus Kentrum sp. LPFa TaxID=2126335 RepID=A0A450X1S7_9GAMM|nr:MAG: AMP-binding enzyme [Candidatus Kentron sp. LPFa]VFK35243.1 MAG: AMP-binding enzyme [Candidatus Kentron sp. LPFa]
MTSSHNHTPNIELSAAERHKILVQWNDTRTDYPRDKCVHQLFEVQVARTPNALAVALEEQELTYRELNRRANRLACYLQSLGVGPETLVGICVERFPEMVMGLLAILKAGGAYVPLDPGYPKERLAFMLGDAGVKILLTRKKLMGRLPEYQGRVVCLETDFGSFSEKNPVSEVTPENLVYVIYTSGSTGRPKGVSIPHQGLLNLVFWHRDAFDITEKDRSTLLANQAFDAAVWELWPYLAAGASVHPIRERTLVSPLALQHWLVEKAITITFIPTPTRGRIIAPGMAGKFAPENHAGGWGSALSLPARTTRLRIGEQLRPDREHGRHHLGKGGRKPGKSAPSHRPSHCQYPGLYSR